MPITLDSICQRLSEIAPLHLAESWDNVGLLAGDRSLEVERVMTCLTISPPVVDEALKDDVDLVIVHHPLPFRPISRITSDTIDGNMLWRLIGSQVGIYSAHTAFDSAEDGINQRWADELSLANIRPMNPADDSHLGSGRFGDMQRPAAAKDVIRRCLEIGGASAASGQSGFPAVRGVGDLHRPVARVGFACGSGGSFVSDAVRCGCDLLITGEASFHSCLEAESSGLALGLLGHFASERFAMERMAEQLAASWPALTVWASRSERDPVKLVVESSD